MIFERENLTKPNIAILAGYRKKHPLKNQCPQLRLELWLYFTEWAAEPWRCATKLPFRRRSYVPKTKTAQKSNNAVKMNGVEIEKIVIDNVATCAERKCTNFG